jgi:hypothetical protein
LKSTFLDLVINNSRKIAPIQFHHAYSKRIFQPKGSALRREVADLRKRRKNKDVIDMLAPFTTSADPSDHHLSFHNTVMRYKCSLLTDEERQENQDWINERLKEKEDKARYPWRESMKDGDDELLAENTYYQKYFLHSFSRLYYKLTRVFSNIDALPDAVDNILEQIERATGMKAMILIGGPTPAGENDFSTH